MFTFFLVAMIVAGTAYGMSEHRAEDVRTVSDFDLDRYLGRWYEIARCDHRFERGLDYVTAEYSTSDDGRLRVVNRGYDNRTGRLRESVGKAKTTSVAGRLRVSFFLFFYSDYDILAIGDDYGWVLVGSSSPKYLWIMSRTPSMSADELSKVLDIATARGYDVSKLIYPAQRPAAMSPVRNEPALR